MARMGKTRQFDDEAIFVIERVRKLRILTF